MTLKKLVSRLAPATVKFKSRFVSQSRIDLIAVRELINRTDVPDSLKWHTAHRYDRHSPLWTLNIRICLGAASSKMYRNYFAKIHIVVFSYGYTIAWGRLPREITGLIRPGLSSARGRLIAEQRQRLACVRLSFAAYKRTRGREMHRDRARIKDALAYTWE